MTTHDYLNTHRPSWWRLYLSRMICNITEAFIHTNYRVLGVPEAIWRKEFEHDITR